MGRPKREKLCEVNIFYTLLIYVEFTRVCRYVCMEKFIELYNTKQNVKSSMKVRYWGNGTSHTLLLRE